MNTNSYLLNIIKKYSILGEESIKIRSRIRPLYREIKNWAGEYFVNILPSGSFAKGTAIRGAVDIDLLISLKNQTPNTLKEIYESLYANLSTTYIAKKQNVSIGIQYQGKHHAGLHPRHNLKKLFLRLKFSALDNLGFAFFP